MSRQLLWGFYILGPQPCTITEALTVSWLCQKGCGWHVWLVSSRPRRESLMLCFVCHLCFAQFQEPGTPSGWLLERHFNGSCNRKVQKKFWVEASVPRTPILKIPSFFWLYFWPPSTSWWHHCDQKLQDHGISILAIPSQDFKWGYNSLGQVSDVLIFESIMLSD